MQIKNLKLSNYVSNIIKVKKNQIFKPKNV